MIEPTGPESHRRVPRPAAVVALVLIAGVIGAAVSAGVTLGILHLQSRTNPQTIDLGSRVTITEESAVVQVAARALPSVVTIVTQANSSTPSFGSGFLVTTDGEVVTSLDLIAHAKALTVLLPGDPKAHSARLLDYDCETGVAVLKIDGVSNLPTLSFGSSAALKPGQTVIALAGPLDTGATVSQGIVSAVGAPAAISNPITGHGTESFSDTIRTNAGIDSGSSGGPLLNVAGQVVGVDVAGTDGGTPTHFALASDDVQPDVQQILSNGRLTVPVLGASGRALGPAEAALRGLPTGLLVEGVAAGSPAKEAGIKAGDVITQIDNVVIDSSHPLPAMLRAHFRPDQRVVVTIMRGGTNQQVALTLNGGTPACPA